jgi:group I intron endonuclease
MRHYYVYVWTNLTNGKRYVGKGCGKRYLSHFAPSERSLLAKAVRKHGRGCFWLAFVGVSLSETDAHVLEAETISRLDTQRKGYNITAGGEGASGWKQTPEHVEKRAAAKRGKPCPGGGRPKGSESVQARRLLAQKLTDAQVSEIRKLLTSGISQERIAKQFRIAQTSVSNIKHGRTYRELQP